MSATESTVTDPRYSPLHAQHVEAGAQFTDFAGWQMPVRYTSDLVEHKLVREGVGLFDLSHMGEIEIHGTYAPQFLDFALAGQLSTIDIGVAKYTLLLNEHGGIIDDLIVYRVAELTYLIVANASNAQRVTAELIARRGDYGVRITDASADYALIAVQGPASQAVLEAVDGFELGVGELPLSSLDDLRYYRIASARIDSRDVLVARTGYTGEDGFELFVDVDQAADVWRRVLAAGEQAGIAPCGLACRDTLRLEAGMPLYGHELNEELKPAQAGLGRVVAFSKPGYFIGREACSTPLLPEEPLLVGLAAEGRRAGRADYLLYAPGGDEVIGRITSGALSPTLGYPIAMAYVDPRFAPVDSAVEIDVRGTRLPAHVTKLPFYRRAKA